MEPSLGPKIFVTCPSCCNGVELYIGSYYPQTGTQTTSRRCPKCGKDIKMKIRDGRQLAEVTN